MQDIHMKKYHYKISFMLPWQLQRNGKLFQLTFSISSPMMIMAAVVAPPSEQGELSQLSMLWDMAVTWAPTRLTRAAALNSLGRDCNIQPRWRNVREGAKLGKAKDKTKQCRWHLVLMAYSDSRTCDCFRINTEAIEKLFAQKEKGS